MYSPELYEKMLNNALNKPKMTEYFLDEFKELYLIKHEREYDEDDCFDMVEYENYISDLDDYGEEVAIEIYLSIWHYF